MAEQKTEQGNDVENYEKRRDYMRKESAPSHHDGDEYPSSEDVLGARGDAAGTGTPDVPAKDEVASDASTEPNELHGSLHGRWNATDEGDKER